VSLSNGEFDRRKGGKKAKSRNQPILPLLESMVAHGRLESRRGEKPPSAKPTPLNGKWKHPQQEHAPFTHTNQKPENLMTSYRRAKKQT